MRADTTSAFHRLRGRVLRDIELQELDPSTDSMLIEHSVERAVAEYQLRVEAGEESGPPLASTREMEQRLLRSITDFGPLADLLASPDVEEIFIEGDRVTYLDGSGMLRSRPDVTTVEEMSLLLARMLSATNRHLDASQPIVQARVLDGGARLTAVIPPVSDLPSATIRRYALRRETLDHLVSLGSITEAAARFLRVVCGARTSVLISGPPGAGKTSLLAAMLAAVPADHCVRCVEEVRELHVSLSAHSSFYEARPPGLDGAGEVSMRALVKLVLAMRPDRIVVGEVRGAEAFELTRAANAGCGFACTIHANSASDALAALVSAAMMAGENVVDSVVRDIFASSVDIVVHVARDSGGKGAQPIRRQLMEIVSVAASGTGGFATTPLFTRPHLGAELDWTGELPPPSLQARLKEAGAPDLAAICAGEE